MLELEPGKIIDDRYEIVDEVGSGNAGTVFRVKQLGIDTERAMKILDPKLETVKQERFRKGFREEIQKLSQLTHRNLVKLIDARESEMDGQPLLYYVMDLVHPRPREKSPLTLDKWASEVAERESFVSTVLQLTNGLSYLHSRSFLHCDIKPRNVMLEPLNGGEYDLKIGDLGSSKLVLEANTADTRETYVIGTVTYCPQYAQAKVNAWPVSRATLHEWFPHYDLFCLGATLAEVVSRDNIGVGDRDFESMLKHPKENVKAMFHNDYDLLARIILQLVQKKKEECFGSVNLVREAIRKLRPEYLMPLGVSEMAVGGAYRTLTQPREKVYLSKRAYEVVQQPVFQRLNRLNQLNFVYMLYSGATHSRFEHSLSTYEMAKRYIEGLLGDPCFKYLMYKQDFELFLAAALLHDIGQYPLAHAIEDLRGVKHEGVESGVKADYAMATCFLNLSVAGSTPIADLLAKPDWKVDPERLIRMVAKGETRSETDCLIQSMLDGPIDVDKVSYLLGDSYFTGTRYGLGIDIHGFLSSLVAIPWDGGKRHSQIGVSDEGVVAAEGVISARYSMFSRVYWHHFNRAIMAMVRYAAAKIFLSPNKECSFNQYIEESFGLSDFEALKYLADRLDVVLRNQGLAQPNLLRGLLDNTRTVHRRFLTFSARFGSPNVLIHRFLVGLDFAELSKLRLEILHKLDGALSGKFHDSDVLLDVPKSEKTSDMLRSLYVWCPDGPEPYSRLSEMSRVVESQCEEFESLTKKCRIYVSPGLKRTLDGDERLAKKAKDEVLDLLEKGAKLSP